jgi:hypothetical protein
LLGYGDWFASQWKFCEAQQQYEAALGIRDDPVARPTADFAARKCQEANAPANTPVPQDTQTPTSTVESAPVENTPTPTATEEVPTETPTETSEPPTPYP